MKDDIQATIIIRRLAAAISCLTALFFACPEQLHATVGGDIAWEYQNIDTADQIAAASAVDSAGNIIITGYSNKNGTDDFYTIKIKADHSGVLWRSTLNLAGYSGRAVAVAVDSDDNVIVTGTGNSSDYIAKIITIKYCGNTVTAPPGYDSPDGSPYPGLCSAGDPIWTATYAAPSRGDAYPTSLAVDAAKNIYVGGAGQPQSGGTNDFILLKYASGGPNGDGSPAWQRSYAGLGEDHDNITDVATCSIPNSSQYFVAVTGHIKDSGGSRIHTIKYTSAGTRLWEKTILNAKVNTVNPQIAMDSNCNVIVAGSVVRATNDGDIYTIQYAANNGATLWTNQIAGNDDNQPNDIYIDRGNNVLLVGRTYENGQNYNFYTARLNDSTGAILWQKPYDSGGNWDEALSVTVDTVTSSVYVLGFTNDNTDYDFRTIKYSLADGNSLWNKPFDSAVGNQNDRPIGISLNAAGEVLVSGYIDTVISGNSYDYYVIKYYPGLLDPPTDLNASFRSGPNIALTWTDNSYNFETGFEIHRSTKSFEIGSDTLIHTTAANVTSYNDSTVAANTRYYYRVRAKQVDGMVTNMSHSSNQVSTLTTIISYGAPDWQHTYNGAGSLNDEAHGIAIGPDLNPVVTGLGVSSFLNTNYWTLKLDRSNGSILWSDYHDYAIAKDEIANDVVVASDNGILITGTAPLISNGVTSFGIKTVAYDSNGLTNGTSLWEYDYDRPGSTEYGTMAVYNSAGDSWAMAGFGDGAHGTDIYLAQFNRVGTEEDNGQPLWPGEVKTYDSGGYDTPTGMIFDSHGDLIVSGNCNGTSSNGPFDILLMKYNDSTGVNIWTKKYDHHGGDDRSSGIILDDNDDIYLSGYVTNDSSKDFYTAKYDGATGDRLWYKIYNGPANGDDTTAAIAFDRIGKGEVIVGGTILSTSNNHDFLIVRYDPADGAVIREIPLDRISEDDHLLVMGTDASGSMCVAGTTGTAGGGEDIIGVRYDWDGSYIDSMRFNGSGNGSDIPYDVAANSQGEIFVAGKTRSASNLDYLVLKCKGEVVQTPFPFTLTPYYTSVDLSWSDNSLNESGFEIERDQRACLENDSWVDWVGKRITISAADTTAFIDDKEVSQHQAYCYRIRTIRNDNKTSRWVYQQTTTLDPGEPTNLTATKLHTTGIKLEWEDNTNGETEFIIERCEGVNCAADESNFIDFHHAAANERSWTDLSLCEGNTYSYRIKARNNDSNAWITAASTAVTVSTDAMAAPFYLQATRVSEGRINLSWNDSNLNENGVKIYRCQNSGCTDFNLLTTLAPNPATANVIPDPSRKLYLQLENASYSGSPGEVLDGSGSGYNATAYGGLQSTSGIKGKAILFDGINDSLSTDLPADQSFAASQLTMSAWVYPVSTSTGFHHVICTADTLGGYDWAIGRYGGAWKVVNGTDISDPGFIVDVNTWQHIAAVFQNGKVVFYKNGQPSAEFSTSFDAIAGYIAIGANKQFNIDFFDGKIDEVSIFERALSADEIKILYTDYLADANTDRTLELLMDESGWNGAANEVKDQSVNQAHGQSYNGANTIADPSRGRVGDFDGVNDYINLGTPAPLQGTGSQTIAFWINPDTLSARSNPYSKAYGGEGAITIETNGQVHYYYGTTGLHSGTVNTAYQNFMMTPEVVPIGTWTHLAIVRDLSAMKLRWYKNGVFVNETPALFSAAVAGTLPAYIGKGYTGNYFDGRLDEFIILNRALSSAEIANLYNPPTVYADTSVLPDTTYRYQVSAFNNDAACPWETSHTAFAANTSSLATPATLSGTVLNTTKVNLSWQDHFEFENGYILQRCDTTLVASCDNDSDFTVSTTIGSTAASYNDSTVKENRSYVYRVKGIKTTAPAWQSPYSNNLTLQTNAKAVPYDFNVSRVNEEEILLTWSTADTDQDGFQIFRCQNASCTSYTLLKTIGPGSKGYTDTHLSSDTTYRYQVRAFKNLNSTENEWFTAYAALSSGGNDTATTTIYVPVLSTATATSTNTISLVWNDPTGRETDYSIERCTGASCSNFVQVASSGRDSTGYTDSSSAICASSTYNYRIRAVERGLSSGNGAYWSKKKKINFSNFIAYYPIRLAITYVADMQNDFDDLRFYDETEQHEIPYWLESKTDGSKAYVWIMTGGSNSIYLYYKNSLAFSASDPASVAVFINSSYYDFFDNFAGRKSSIDNTKWLELDASSNKISQNNGLLLNSVGSTAWDTALISQSTFSRRPGKSASAGISSLDTSGDKTSMFGWELNQNDSAHYNRLLHGLQFTQNGENPPKAELRPYEIGTHITSSSTFTATYTEVDVRLTATGASYWRDGAQFKTSSSYNDSPLRLAFHQKDHKAKVYWVAVRTLPATPPAYSFEPATDVSSCPSANTWSGAYSNTLTVSTETVPASAPTDLAVSPSSDSTMLDVTWTSNTSDEDAFYLQRCDKAASSCPVANDSLFTTVATVVKNSYVTSLIPSELALNMDEASWNGTANQVTDSSGKGVNATAFGGASTVLDEVRGQVGKFDGSDDYVKIPGDTTLQHTTDSSYTFAAWVKPANKPANADKAPTYNDQHYGILQRANFGLRYTFGRRFIMSIVHTTGSIDIRTEVQYEPGFWHHVAGVVNDSAKTITLYVDGALQKQTTYTDNTLKDNGTEPYYVGVSNPGTDYTWYFEGLIDEARIFNKALTAAEVQAFYAGPVTYSLTDTGLIPGAPYTYRVQAVKSSGNCDWSLISTASTGTTILSEAVPGFSAAIAPDTPYNAINLSWQVESHTNTGFVIVRSQGQECSNNSDDYSTIVATLSGNDTTFSDTSLCPGTSYCYGIKGINQAFNDMGSGLSNNGGNTPWSRRKALSITNFQENYQTKLEVALDPDMKKNFNDIRFYDATAKAELPYWIEKQTNGVSATVWLKTGNNNSIKMYYGNPNATSSSNGASVFTFFDDFNDGVIDTAKWPTRDTGSGYISEEPNGELKLTRRQNGSYYIRSNPIGTSIIPFVLTARTKTITTPSTGWSPLMWHKDSNDGMSILEYPPSNNTQVVLVNNTWAFFTPGYIPLDEWHQNSLILKNATTMAAMVEFETTKSRNWSYTSTTNTTGNHYIKIGPRSDDAGTSTIQEYDGRVDWIFMRKWAETEPTVTVSADEEEGATVWSSAYAFTTTPGNQLATPTPPSNVMVSSVSEAANSLTWTDNLDNEDGYLIERCQGSTCSDFNLIAKVSKNFKDDFSSGIEPSYWNSQSVVVSKNDSVPPIYINDSSGSGQIIAENGKVILHTVANNVGYNSYNTSKIYLKNPTVLGNDDFDIQVDYNLPYPIPTYNQYHVYARLTVVFNTGDSFCAERVHEINYQGYLTVNHVIEYAYLATDQVSSGKLRLTRSGNVLSTYAWNNDQWFLLKTHSQMVPAHAAVNNVFLYQYAYRGETTGVQDLTTEFDNFQISQKTGTFTFLDTGAIVAQPFNTILQPANWILSGLLESGEQTVAPIAFNDSSGSVAIDLSKGTASLHTSSSGSGSSGNYNRSSLDLKIPGEVVMGNQNFDLQLKFNITNSTCSKAANGLEVYLKMEEDSWNGTADEVLDYSGIGRNGTAISAVIVNDSIRGKVGYFDGINDTIESPVMTGNKIISVAGTHTIATWFKALDGGYPYPWLVAFIDSTFNEQISTALSYNNAITPPYLNGIIRTWTEDTSSGIRAGTVTTSSQYNDSNWHHAAYTYSTSNGGILYVDGILVGTSSYSPTSDIRDGEAFVIGGRKTNHMFNGLIDETRIFTKELSASEVRLLANDSFHDDGIVPIGIRIGFNNNDFLTLERSGGTNGEYFATGMINNTAESKNKATSAASGRLRINRSGDTIYASYWNGSDWTTLQARTNLPSSAQVTSVQIYNQAARDSICELDTTVSSLIVTANNSTHYYFDNESLISGRPYTYRVSPYKEGNTCSNWTSYSGSASMTPAAIPAPSGLTTTSVGTTRVDLRWTDSTSSETNFEIQRCTGSCNFSSGAGNDTKTFTVAANVSSFSDLTAVQSSDYRYRVRAINSSVPWSSNDSSVLPVRTLAPIAPSNLVVTYGSEIRLNLAWHDNSPDETNFMVERGDANCTPSSFNPIATLAAGTTSYSDSGLNYNTTYCYRVRAYQDPGYGNSWYSAYSNNASEKTLIKTPSSITATASPFNTNLITLTWNDSAESETGYRILRCQGPKDTTCKTSSFSWPLLADVNKDSAHYTNSIVFNDSTACEGTTYSYAVRPIYKSGSTDLWNGLVDMSPTEDATTMMPEPAFNFKVTEINNDSSESRQMLLYWEYNDSDKSGFKIGRCIDSNGENCINFEEIATIPIRQTHDTFDAAIQMPSLWIFGGEIQGSGNPIVYNNNTAPINYSNTVGAIKVTAAGDGIVELYAKTIRSNGPTPIDHYTQAYIKLAEPSFVGPGDFDLQVTFRLPDGLLNDPYMWVTDHRYIRMSLTFPDSDGAQRLDSDFAYIEYKINQDDSHTYSTSVQIDNNIQNSVSSPVTHTSGKLRIRRQENKISTYYWDHTTNSWQMLIHHDTIPTLIQAPDKVQISTMVQYKPLSEVTLRTEIEDFKIAKSSASYTDTQNLAPYTTYRYTVMPYKDNAPLNCNWGADLNNPIATNLTRPVAPSGLTATVLNHTVIKLKWTDNNHSGNGYYADGYEVERLTWNGHYQKIYTSDDRDKIFTNDSRSYITSAGNEPGKKYTYRVRAYRGEDKSAYSNTATTSDKDGNETTTWPFDYDPENYNHRPSE